MKFTGERLINGMEGQIKLEHLHRYSLAFPFANEKIVLDIACGDGYGTALLADVAYKVEGVDLDSKTIEYASKKYLRQNINFTIGDILNIPFEDNFFDLIICFETFEHLDEHDRLLNEVKRVLKDDGILIMSTPEKSVYSDARNYSNKFHKKELYLNEYKDLLKNHFNYNQFLYQKFIVASLIYEPTKNGIMEINGNYDSIAINKEFQPKYMVSISSKYKLDLIGSSIFNDVNQIDLIVNKIKSSYDFRIGKFILTPFRFTKNTILKLFPEKIK
jgi:ubiquinone/menaquinone biosynthesis C-methylase UbiE